MNNIFSSYDKRVVSKDAVADGLSVSWSLSTIDMDELTLAALTNLNRPFNDKDFQDKLDRQMEDNLNVGNPYYILHTTCEGKEEDDYPPFELYKEGNHFVWVTGDYDHESIMKAIVGDDGQPNWNRLKSVDGNFACIYLHEGNGIYAITKGDLDFHEEPQGISTVMSKMEAIESNSVYNLKTLEKIINI